MPKDFKCAVCFLQIQAGRKFVETQNMSLELKAALFSRHGWQHDLAGHLEAHPRIHRSKCYKGLIRRASDMANMTRAATARASGASVTATRAASASASSSSASALPGVACPAPGR